MMITTGHPEKKISFFAIQPADIMILKTISIMITAIIFTVNVDISSNNKGSDDNNNNNNKKKFV